MRLVIVILTACLVQVSAATFGQRISLSESNAPLEQVLKKIKLQSGVNFLYADDLFENVKKVNVKLNNGTLEQALSKVFENQPVSYEIQQNTVIVKLKEPSFLERVVDAFTPPIDVRGVVVDEKGLPLAGANVKVKGFKQTAVTDNEGRFYLPGVDDKAVLIISFVGYKDVEVGAKASLSVVLEMKAAELNEVVVAYGKTTQQALTGAVTVVKGEQIQSLPNRSFDKSLQGLVPGLLVTSGNGQPGSPPVNFILRGIATGGQPTKGQTYKNPLIVIDGMPVFQDPPNIDNVISDDSPSINPMAQFNPSDIESISVLKDAAAVALYGSKASNGVILVTTKKGKAGKTVFNFRSQTDISGRLDGGVEMLNQQQYLELLYEAYKNSNPTLWTDAAILADLKSKFPIQPDGSFYPQSDWSNELFKKNAITLSNEISMSGGNDKSNFYLNLEYTKQDAIVKNTGYDRKSTRFNYENRPVKTLKLGVNSVLSYNIQDFSNVGSFDRILRISPLNPIRNNAGEYIYNYGWGLGSSQRNLIPNPLAESELNINRNRSYRGLSKIYGELNFLKFFTLTSNLGVDFSLNEIKEKIHPFLAINGRLDYGGTLKQSNYRTANVINSNILRFDIVAQKKHSINVLLGEEAQVFAKKNTVLYKHNFLDNPSQDQLSSGTVLTAIDQDGRQTLLSYFGQVNYGFSNKYFLSGSVRTDGSSLFGKNEKFGTYWSIGSGWVLTEESFLKNKTPWLNYLKLRGSFGPAGNSSAILNYLSFDFLRRASPNAVFPDEYRNPGNPSIKWEKTFAWDIGAELRMLKERVTFTADFYSRKTKNLIANNVPLALVTGFDLITANIGDISNTGVELSVSAQIVNQENFSWNFSANWSRNKNTLTKSNLSQEAVVGSSLINKVGEEYNSFYLPQWAGVNPDNGRPMWIDSLGKANEDYNAAKYIIAGKTQPDGFGSVSNSFSWKNIQLTAMLYYQYGGEILYPGSLMQNDGASPYLNQSIAALDRWQKPGDISETPRRLLNGRAGSTVDQGRVPSTRFLYKGDFVRLSNIMLSYNLPQRIVNRIRFNNIKVFVQGHNLATWTPYSGQDPENLSSSGIGGFSYPQQRSFTIGINASF